MAEGNSNGNGPTWLKAAVQLGVPSVIALGLVYWIIVVGSEQVDQLIRETAAASKAHDVDYRELRSIISSHVDATGRTNAEVLFYQRQQCLILAQLANVRVETCVPPRTP